LGDAMTLGGGSEAGKNPNNKGKKKEKKKKD